MKRPEGYDNEQRDCVVVALSRVANISYEKSHIAWELHGRKYGHKVKSKEIFPRVCKTVGVSSHFVRSRGTVKTLIKDYPRGRLFVLKRGHAFAIIDGKMYDEDKIGSHVKAAWLIGEVQ